MSTHSSVSQEQWWANPTLNYKTLIVVCQGAKTHSFKILIRGLSQLWLSALQLLLLLCTELRQHPTISIQA